MSIFRRKYNGEKIKKKGEYIEKSSGKKIDIIGITWFCIFAVWF